MAALPLSDLHLEDRTFRAVLETIPDAVILVDRSGRIAASNEVAERVFGWSEGELQGRPVEDLMPQRYRPDHPRLVQQYFASPQVVLGPSRFRHGEELELTARRKSGEEFPVEISVGPIEIADGSFALAVMRDVTEARKLRARLKEYNRTLEQQVRERTAEIERKQAELLQAAKVAALAQLTAGVVHQINTPLGALRSANQTALSLARRLAADSEAAERLGAVLDDVTRASEQAVEQLSRTIGSLRTFSRVDFGAEGEADLLDGLRSALALIEPQTAQRVRVETDFAPLPPVRARHGDLNQVFMNVLLNAVEAIEGEGALRVAARAEDGVAVVSVTDTGVGIDEALRQRVFDPGFTTKGVRVGAGLGMAIVKQVLDEHGGSIEIESQPGEGSTVTLRIPLRG
ncbi:MAG: PAS domain S-box protein [Acidobacteria bacterium]|nr:PAS domain S-box protein [Acidobacteriota bacterium]